MKRIILFTLTLLCVLCVSAQEQQQRQRRPRYVIPTDAPILNKQANGSVVINTSALCTDVRGYRDMTPVEITITKGKVTKVEALRNNETPKYMDMVKPLLDKWNGKTVKAAQTAKVDAVTGATFTSKALIENVQKGLKYYQEKK
jgi:electron transport complex protein RnfG